MGRAFVFLKANSIWIIPTSGLLCIVSVVLRVTSSSIGFNDFVDALRFLMSFLLLSLVGVALMIGGKFSGNQRVQKLAIFLAGIYLGVETFANGVDGLFLISGVDPILKVVSALAFLSGLCWLFILFEGSFGYASDTFDRRLGPLAYASGVNEVLLIGKTIARISYVAVLIGRLQYNDFILWSEVFSDFSDLFFFTALFATFTDVYHGPVLPKKREDRNVEDLDIHSY